MKNEQHIAIIGLGYVGLPLAVEFSKQYTVTGFDIDQEKIDKLRKGIDITNEISHDQLKQASLRFTSEQSELKNCNVFIVTVPTPILPDKKPDLKPLVSACQTIAKSLNKDDLVLFESTVYPGTTEEVCVPILEAHSELKLGLDFKVGYSPERINPGDKKYTLTNIVKIVSGSDREALEQIDHLYSSIIEVGTFRVSSIKVAEAAKVIENAQRDINIAFMNELAIVFDKMEIDTTEVLNAASTKWNFLRFQPGLVGGHCIGIDPYYFIYKAEQLGYHSQILTAARKMNNGMSSFVVKNVVKEIFKQKTSSSSVKIGILGITFKENWPDPRNTQVIDIIEELKEYGFNIIVYDPVANEKEIQETYGIRLVTKKELVALDTVVVAVAHDQFKQEFPPYMFRHILKSGRSCIFDLKSMYNQEELAKYSLESWRL